MQIQKKEDIKELLRSNSLKVTSHRVDILFKIAKAKVPISAQSIMDSVSNNKDLNQSTVYRNLNELEKAGLIRKYSYGNNSFIYEISTHSAKNQIICQTCGAIESFSATIFADQTKKVMRRSKKFKNSSSADVHVYTLCKNCS